MAQDVPSGRAVNFHDVESWSDSEDEGLRGPELFPCAFGGAFGGFGSWFGSRPRDVVKELRKEIKLLKRENRQLRDLAKNKGASVGDIRRATDIFEPLTPVCHLCAHSLN